MPHYLVAVTLLIEDEPCNKTYLVELDCLLCAPLAEKKHPTVDELFKNLTLAGYITRITRYQPPNQAKTLYADGFIGPPEPRVPWVAGVTQIDELPRYVQQRLVNVIYEHLLETPNALQEEMTN